MDWNARSAWHYAPGQLPDTAKARRYGVWYVYLDPTDAKIGNQVDVVRGAGLFPCLYVAWNWPGHDGTPQGFAKFASDLANKHLPRQGTAEAPAVMLDIELHDRAWIAEALVDWRAHQPRRPTALTTEPLQGSFVPYATLRVCNTEYYPQTFFADPDASRQPDLARVVLEPCRFGFDPKRIHPLYDGRKADISTQWDGCYFTLERMA